MDRGVEKRPNGVGNVAPASVSPLRAVVVLQKCMDMTFIGMCWK